MIFLGITFGWSTSNKVNVSEIYFPLEAYIHEFIFLLDIRSHDHMLFDHDILFELYIILLYLLNFINITVHWHLAYIF